MKNLKKYAENLGKKTIIVLLLIDIKRGNKEDAVYIMKAKTHI